MIRETTYQEIQDSQRHFRTLLDSMSRPGKLNRFAPVALTPPPGLHRAAAYVGLALLNADASFHAESLSPAAVDYLRANTHAPVASQPTQADFIFVNGLEPRADGLLAEARVGQPAYPETGASLVVQVSTLGKSSHTGGLQLELVGPGIESREIVFVHGLRAEILQTLRVKNQEFPLGIDLILVSEDETLLCLPRTTKITWSAV
jgi:alpha-D-ribose 1-methylphosphonate 5-triphosphate synthase subunit PhnH